MNPIQSLLDWLKATLDADPWYAEHGVAVLIENQLDILSEVERAVLSGTGCALILRAPRAENNRPALNVSVELLALENPTLNRVADYMARRASNHIQVVKKYGNQNIPVMMNSLLFEWVIENLSKNAIDAMAGSGTLTYDVKCENGKVYIDVSDTGKGIAHKDFKSVFSPGFTTKRRGWGLGLTLAKRIVEEYHNGKIYVLNSEIGRGTTFRIEMKQ